MNIDFKNLSDEDKRKIVAYGIFGIVSIVVLFVGVSFIGGSDNKNKEVENLEVVSASEQEQYETRLQAMKKFDTVAPNPNERMTQFFNTEQKEDIKNDIAYFENNKNNVQNENVSDSKSPIRNNNTERKHNKYGNSNMWEVEEPKDNNIGYTNNPNKEYLEKRYEEINNVQNENVSEQKEIINKKISKKNLFENGKQNQTGSIKAVIRGTQDLKNGQTLRFQTSEEGVSNGVKIPKNTALFGVVRFTQYRAEIVIETANINGNILPVNLIVYSSDGIKGIPIAIDENVKQGRNSTADEIGRTGGIVGKAGGIVGSVISGKMKEPTVKFIDNQRILLIQK